MKISKNNPISFDKALISDDPDVEKTLKYEIIEAKIITMNVIEINNNANR